MILDMPIDDRLRQIEANANFFLSIRPLDDQSEHTEDDKEPE